MTNEEFFQEIDKQIIRCKRRLSQRQEKYAPLDDDRLSQFKKMAVLQGITPLQALAGAMAKHSTLLYDMMMGDVPAKEKNWNETITDHINYLFLARALVQEELDG
jgi:hypothetical protein